MDGKIEESHFTRLCGIPRPTRAGWADEKGWLSPQSSPYPWTSLVEAMIVRVLRDELPAGEWPVVWLGLRDGLPEFEPGMSARAIVNRHTLEASWVKDTGQLIDVLGSGRPAQLFEFTAALEEAGEGFAAAARQDD